METINKNAIKPHMLDGGFGIEKESLRVDARGYLSHTPHPFSDQKNIDRDFCENQIEIITDVFDSVDGAYGQLKSLHDFAVKKLFNLNTGTEFLWNFSNPPYVRGEDDIPVARYAPEQKSKEIYREYLAGKYGKKKMLFSGIHFNFSFSDDYLEECFETSGFGEFRQYKNALYLRLAKRAVQHGWLVVYLMSSSPLMDGSYFRDDDLGKDILSRYASARCSEIGYWNEFTPILEYDNLNAYVQSIQKYIDSGQLASASELYYPVRLKASGKNTLDALKENGVDHIELRNIDLNPLSDIGLMREDIEFLHLLLLYLHATGETSFVLDQTAAVRNVKNAAAFHDENVMIETDVSDHNTGRSGETVSDDAKIKAVNNAAGVLPEIYDDVTVEAGATYVPLRSAALNILHDMESFFTEFAGAREIETVRYQIRKLTSKRARYAVRIMDTYYGNYVKQGLEMARRYALSLITPR